MKNTLLLFLLIHGYIFVSSLSAQTLHSWLKSTTSDNLNISSRFFGSTYDNDHFYLVGEYWRDIAFDEYDLALLTGDQSHNGFITKMNTLGETVALFDISGSNLQRTTDIAVSNDGTLWVSGLFREEMIYSSQMITAQGYFESFLLHLTEDGELLEMYHFPVVGVYDGVSLYNIEMDLNGNLWLAFSFLGDFIFDEEEYNGGINQDGLLVQVSPAGEVLQSHYFAASENSEEPPPLLFLDMKIDTENNLILAGTLGGEVTIDGVAIENVSPFTADAFVAKFASDGPLLWTRTYTSNDARVNSIAIDDKDRIYLGFQFADFIIFENETLNGSLSFADMAIARISPQGSPQWIELYLHGFNPGTNGGVYPMSLQLLEEQLIVGGFFDDRIMHQGQVVLDGVDQQLGCILNMDLNGEIIDSWMVSSPNYTRINTMMAAFDGLWYGGEYFNSAEVEEEMVSSPASALFYGLLAADQIVSNQKLNILGQVSVFPNPIQDRLQINGLPDYVGQLTVRDISGRLCATFSTRSSPVTLDLDFLPSGFYVWEWYKVPQRIKGSFIKM